MNRLIAGVIATGILMLTGAGARAEFKRVENFDKMATGSPDGVACTGVLGGTWDTETANTGNVTIEDNSGSRVLRFMTTTAGDPRGVGFNGITNAIDDGEAGKVFFRFQLRSDSQTPRTYIGLISETGNNPITGTNSNDPTTIPAGFGLVNDGAGGFNLTKTDGTTILKTGLKRLQWYNVWIIADNAADKFDVYLSTAAAPAGDATLPSSGDLVASAIPFGVATNVPLTGMIFACTRGTTQSTRTYIDEIWWDGDQGLAAPKRAGNPSPGNGATEVANDVVLGWKPVSSAVTNTVYFGTSKADVTAASAENPLGVLVSTGSDANTYDPAGLLAYGQTYYWRVDEVNTVDQTVYAGSIWSFTIEAPTYALTNVTATASGFAANQGPEKTADRSGLDAGDLHGTTDSTMWLSDGVVKPAWIQYAFNDTYKVQEMWVWNSNLGLESTAGLGAKDVTIEYSADGATWTTLTGVPAFARAPGAAGYAHNTTVDFGGVVAQYVKLTINANWGGLMPQTGLSEVRFFYKPVRARDPQPVNARTGVAPDVTLSWRMGHEAAAHNVYFGADANALTSAGTVTESKFTPAAVNLGTTYYWRVDEVNAAETPGLWTGQVWSFTTSEYVTIDDIESYNDTTNPIFNVWTDGYSTPIINGSLVGYDTARNGTFCETTIVHGGRQSMPVSYGNGTASISEIERTWDTPQNWAANGANTLSLWFRGNPTGFVALASDHLLMNGLGSDIYSTADQGRFVYQQLTGNATIIARVDRLDAVDPWAKAAVMIRQSLDPASVWGMAVYGAENGFRFQTRLTPGGAGGTDSLAATAAQIAVRTPVWIKLERTGNTFNAYYATAAAPTTWIGSPSNPQTITMTDPVYIGLACTSHSNTTATQAEFSAITTTGNITGSWQSADLGITQPTGNALQPLYVIIKDVVGKSATIKHSDAAAVTAGTWQQWKIPLSSLTGVDASGVKTMIIGIGDRANPKPGSGLIYIDDIQFGRPAQ